MKKTWLAVALVFGLPLGACAPSKPPATLDEIKQLTKIAQLMGIQARAADPLFKQANGDWSQADWAKVAESALRLDTTSGRIKALSRGVKWDNWAGAVNTQALALGQAAQNKDGTAAKAALTEMKMACKACHSKYK